MTNRIDGTRYWAATVLLAVVASLLSDSCRNVPDGMMSGAKGLPCIADSVPALTRTTSVPPCQPSDLPCRAQCQAGDAAACLGLAYAAQADPAREAEAVRLYQRACLLGEANACTNYAAHIWANDYTDEQLTCARRVFEKVCAADEPFACGMVGRVMLESESPPRFAEGRQYLETSCARVSGFPCRVLAKHLETGELGEYQPGTIQALLAKACSGGDPDACGEPKSAAETFH